MPKILYFFVNIIVLFFCQEMPKIHKKSPYITIGAMFIVLIVELH